MPEPRLVPLSPLGMSPEEIATRTFASVRRGFSPEAVRRFLEDVAAHLREVRAREAELRVLLADAEQRAASPVLDEAVLSAAVGTETARVLQVAHEAAQEVVAKAEARAATVLEEAEAVHATRAAAAEDEAARIVEEGRRAVEGLVERTKQECRSMLDEAREARRRVLDDLAARRRDLHNQIGQLRAAKDALAEIVAAAADAVVDVRSRLAGSEEEAREAAEVVAHQVFEGDGLVEVDEVHFDAGESPRFEVGPGVAVSPAVEDSPVPEGAPEANLVATGDVAAGSEPAQVRETAEAVDALFARIRASRAEEVAKARAVLSDEEVEGAGAGETAEDEAGGGPQRDEEAPEAAAGGASAGGTTGTGDAEAPEPGEAVAAAGDRDELLEDARTEVARALKRVLRSLQNELLDAARSLKVSEAESLLAGEEAGPRIAEEVEPALAKAWRAGFVRAGGRVASEAETVSAAAGELASGLAVEVVGAIEARLREGITSLAAMEGEGPGSSAGDEGLGDLVGVAYRDWKGAKVDGLAADEARRAFAAGTVAGAAETGARVRWVVDSGQPCADCDDNALSEPIAPGEPFPTGQVHPPLHGGCRCVLVAVPR